MRGRFVVVEGGEGSGKSTQARRLASRLGALLTREPGGTAAGRALRALVLEPATVLDDRAEALLLAADRAQHVEEVVRPALEKGLDVVSDRYAASTFAYQGWGRGLDVEELRRLSAWAAAGLEPDLVVLLEIDPSAAARRLEGSPDRMEGAGVDFHHRVAAGYRALADADPVRWRVVDATPDEEAVAEAVWQAYENWAQA